MHFRTKRGWFLNASPSYTWRDGVALDRPYFYTDGRLTFSDRVAMPDVFDYVLSGGLSRGETVLPASFSQQRTQGGGDIRRQDMPFVSNRMDFSRVGGWAKIPLPKHGAVSIVAGYSHVVDGRNVRQSTTLRAGVVYLFGFPGAGSWSMIVLTSPSQVPLPAPTAVTDSAYLTEIAAVKSAQSQITENLKLSIDYRTRGGVHRGTRSC